MAAMVENLEKLSNNEIRLKCIEFGLPNVPVTDSSRKLLIKRLNDAMNNAAPPKDNLIPINRRETINIAKTAPPEIDMPKNRRTISAATLVTAAKDDNAPTAIPVSTRRRSVQKEPTTETIKPSKTTTKTPLQSILIEDDEEDEVLMNAADNAEKESTTSSVPIENITGRRKSRSVSVPKVTEVINTAAAKKRAMTPLTEDKLETTQHEPSPITKPTVEPPQISIRKENVNIVSVQNLPPLDSPITLSQKQQPTTVKSNFEVLSHQNLQHTTPSVYSTPSLMRYTTIGSVVSSSTTTGGTGGGLGYGSSSSLSSYRTKYTAEHILNELSDTDATPQDDGCKSPFLSNFARDLERRRSVGRSITTTGSNYDHYVRRSGGHEKSAIRGRRGSKADVSMGQILVALNRKYHLKTIFYLLVLACISIFIYVHLYA